MKLNYRIIFHNAEVLLVNFQNTNALMDILCFSLLYELYTFRPCLILLRKENVKTNFDDTFKLICYLNKIS